MSSFPYEEIKWGADISFEFLKTGSQFLGIGLETPPSFFRNQFLEAIPKHSFYKNSIDLNSLCLSSVQFAVLSLCEVLA
jgi:hypothetical protein